MTKNDIDSAKMRREELKREFRANGFKNFTELDVLEFVIMFSVQTGETRTIAEKLLLSFDGSLKGVFNARYEDLKSIKGVNAQTAILLYIVNKFMRYFALAHYPNRVNLFDTEYAAKYLSAYFISAVYEKIIVASLDSKGYLKKIDEFSNNNPTGVSMPISQLINVVIDNKAQYYIVAHNHLNGDVNPSRNDINAAELLKQNSEPIGIKQYQNYILADDKWFALVDDKGNIND